MTQKERIVQYMEDFGSITNLEAFRDLGVGHLASRITELRQLGYPIICTPESSLNRYGEKTSYTRYSMGARNG